MRIEMCSSFNVCSMWNAIEAFGFIFNFQIQLLCLIIDFPVNFWEKLDISQSK